MEENPLYIPIILGTARQWRQSEHVASFLLSEMQKRPEIETEVIDVRQLKMTLDDAGEEMKDPEFAKKMRFKSPGVSSATRVASSNCFGCARRNGAQKSSSRNCLPTASAISLRPWPAATQNSPDEASMIL